MAIAHALCRRLPPPAACAQVPFGHHLVLVGNTEELGGWELSRAPLMSWSEGDVWTASVALPAGAAVEYKFVQQVPNQ